MIAYRLKERIKLPGITRQEAVVRLRANDPYDAAELEFEGDERVVEDVKRELFHTYGFAGAFIDNVTRLIDLKVAMNSALLKSFEPEQIE